MSTVANCGGGDFAVIVACVEGFFGELIFTCVCGVAIVQKLRSFRAFRRGEELARVKRNWRFFSTKEYYSDGGYSISAFKNGHLNCIFRMTAVKESFFKNIDMVYQGKCVVQKIIL